MLRQDEKYNSIASDQNLEKRWMLTILSCTSDLFGGWFFGGLSGRRTVHTLYGPEKLKVPCFAMEDHGWTWKSMWHPLQMLSCKKLKDGIGIIILFFSCLGCLLFALHFFKKASAPFRLILGFQHEWILKSLQSSWISYAILYLRWVGSRIRAVPCVKCPCHCSSKVATMSWCSVLMVAKGSGEPGDGRRNLSSEYKTCVCFYTGYQIYSNMFHQIGVKGPVT